jgi:hypothetical protein
MRSYSQIIVLLLIVSACKNPSKPSVDFEKDATLPKLLEVELLHDALHDSVWMRLTDSLMWSAYFDTINKAVVLDSVTMDPSDLLNGRASRTEVL